MSNFSNFESSQIDSQYNFSQPDYSADGDLIQQMRNQYEKDQE